MIEQAAVTSYVKHQQGGMVLFFLLNEGKLLWRAAIFKVINSLGDTRTMEFCASEAILSSGQEEC